MAGIPAFNLEAFQDKLTAHEILIKFGSKDANGIPSFDEGYCTPSDLATMIANEPGATILANPITQLTAATGVTGNVVNDVGDAFAQATLNNNFKVLADKINAVIAALT